MANKKYLHEIIEENANTPLPYDVVMQDYTGRPVVYAVVYQCDSFVVLENIRGFKSIVSSDPESLADDSIIEDDEVWAKPAVHAVATAVNPSTKRVAKYAYKLPGLKWKETEYYYQDDAEFTDNVNIAENYRRLSSTEIEVPL